MELIVLGAGPAYTNRRGAASAGYLVRVGDAPLLLDLGQGAFANLASTMEPSALAAVLVSHLHPDHFIDLVALRHYLRWEFRPPRRARVLAPKGLADRLDALHGSPGFTAASLDVEPLAEGRRQIGPFAVEARHVTHDEECFAFRVSVAGAGAGAEAAAGDRSADAPSSGPGLVYSGDCGRADDLVPLIRPGDTLLCEASFGAGKVPRAVAHLNAMGAARAATAGGAARLLLTHIQMGFSRAEALAAAQAIFSGPTQLVTEGDRFEV